MTRAVIVGVSGYGRWHLLMAMEQALVGQLRLVGAAVVNQIEEAWVCARLRRQGVPVFSTFEEMIAALKGQFDLVLLPTGIQWHADMTIAALHAGAHVLVEKPVAATLQDVDRMISAAASTRRLIAVGFQDLYVPATHEIKQRIRNGNIGPLRRIIVRAQWPRSSDYYKRNSWAGRLRVGDAWVLDSPINNGLAHFLMLALFWAGDTAEAAADLSGLSAELYRHHAIESYDTVSLRAVTSTGVEIFFHGSHAGLEDCAPEIRLIGGEGEIAWSYENQYVVSSRSASPQTFPLPAQMESRLTVLESMIAHLNGQSAFVVSPAVARAHTRVINAVHEFFPIHDIASEHVQPGSSETGAGSSIRGVDTYIVEAAERGILVSETSAPWGRSAPFQSLSNYERFSGCWTDDRSGPPNSL